MSIKEEVLNVIADVLDVDKEEIEDDKKLCDSLGVDSTEMVEVAVSLGKKFGVKVATSEVTKFSTPEDIVAVIENKKQA